MYSFRKTADLMKQIIELYQDNLAQMKLVLLLN